MNARVLKHAWLVAALTVFVGACKHDGGGAGPGPGEPENGSRPSAAPVTFVLSTTGLPETGYWKCDPVLADVNSDGFMDLAGHIRLGNGPKIWLGDGAGNWRDDSEDLAFGANSCGGGLCFGDVNGDGHLDLVVADHCKGIYVYFGDDAGNWQKVVEELHPEELSQRRPDRAERFVGADCVSLGDVNGDGNLDIVAGSSDSAGIGLYLGDGSGVNWTWHECELPFYGDWTVRVKLVDLNDDGNLDIVASCGSGPRVWLGDGHASWKAASGGLPTPTYGGMYGGIAVGDINEDGRLDIAVANIIDGPEVYLQQPGVVWQKTADVFVEMTGGAFGLDMGDVDQDGHLDMLLSGRFQRQVGYVYGIFLLLGNGRGTWTYVHDSGLPETALSYTWGVRLGDIDGDGVLDALAASGGIVASDRRRSEPILAPRMLVWRTQLNRNR